MTWTDGYVSDVRYPAFFYREMQPLWLSFIAALAGFSAPAPDQPFDLCELGCGVGINLLVAAACHPRAQFIGVDFNEAHLQLARDAAAVCGLDNVAFIHADFAGFAASNSRRFDYITCHGAWSWIAPEHQTAILHVVSRGLKPEGLFHLHYMCHPGSTDLEPLQHLLHLAAHHMPGPSPRKAQAGMALLQRMADSGAFADRPALLRHLANMAKRDPADLAHEFLTDHWRPRHSVDVHQQVAGAGPSFLGSADPFSNLDVSLSVPGALQALVGQTRSPALSETLKDLARNTHQRMDLFQNAPRPLDRDAFLAALGRMRFGRLPGAPDHGPVTFTTPIGPVTGADAVYTPLLQRLAAGPATGAQLSQLAPFQGKPGDLLQALLLLMMQGWAHPRLDAPPAAIDRAAALTRWLQANGVSLTVLPDGATAVAQPLA